MNKSLIFLTIAIFGGLLVLAGCSKHKTVPGTTMTQAQISAIHAASVNEAEQAGTLTPPTGTVAAAAPVVTITKPAEAGTATLPNLAYIALLYPMNSSTIGTSTVGKAQFAIKGDKLTVRINVANAPPNTVHWQHIHGFVNGDEAKCPTDTADVNGDGIIDLIETAPASGTTMIPLNANPVAMDVTGKGYPKASSDGTYMYQKTLSLKALKGAFAKQFNGQKLDLADRVVFIHGVPSNTKLPASVSSLPGAPAQVTIPIACGQITAVHPSPDTTPTPEATAPTPSK